MTYQETIDFLYSRLPMFSRIGSAAYKADLSNTLKLCEQLGNPQEKFKSIHVAGTNGKGSVSHMLASVFQSNGYRTGLYTSPHLRDFRERIRIDGEMVSKEFVTRFTDKIRLVIEEISPSFFEVTVAMAFEYFAENKIDLAIIETGLGGRLDSTNVILPELSVITNIGYDHMNLLGDSLEKIACEKAGIIKPGVPVVIGETISETIPVFKQAAKEKNASLTIASHKKQVMDWAWEKQELLVEVAEDHHMDHRKYYLDLPGVYQKKNLLTVLEAISIMQEKGWQLDDKKTHEGIRHTRKLTGLHGRWEQVHQVPLVILDVAHNEDGMKQLVQQTEIILHRQLHIVIGMVKDKEIDKVLELLPRNANYYFTKAQIARALPEDILMEKAGQYKLKGRTFPEVNEAIVQVMEHAHTDDLVIICGSVFLVGEVDISLFN